MGYEKNKAGQKKPILKAMTRKNIVVLIVIALLMTTCIGSFLSVQSVSNQSEIVVYKVNEGETMNSTIESLHQKNYIRSNIVTKIAASILGIKTVYPGNYSIDLSWNSIDIIRYLSSHENAVNEAPLTLLPNDSATRMADKIAELTGLKASDILQEWNNTEYIQKLMKDYSILTPSVLNDQLLVKLEGYLYPDTYQIHMDVTIDEITRTILNNAQSKYESIKSQIDANQYSTHEIYTLASMIEWEASTQEDRNLVSSVFHNRLNIGMRLESSVTICYALGKFDDWRECEKNPDIESPYNTRLIDGLPIGPILNPTLSSLEAALKPTKSDYLFFLADPQTGKVYYSRTYEEHLEYYEKYLAGQMEGN